jgi:hypothetical protein
MLLLPKCLAACITSVDNQINMIWRDEDVPKKKDQSGEMKMYQKINQMQ